MIIDRQRRRLAGFAWAVLGLNAAVILWGAVVRATGSGAGCGSHWPKCDGAVIPLLEDGKTTIEFIHRATSGVALLAVLALFLWARRLYGPGHTVRQGASLALVFIVIESLLGAALVLFGWVEDDTSVGRILAIAAHLANTFLLLGSLVLTAWWSSGGKPIDFRARPRVARLLAVGAVALVATGALGAVTALGDTLFPSASLVEGLRGDVSSRSEFLVRLRVIHPVLAVGAGLYLVAVVRLLFSTGADTWALRLGQVVTILVFLQIAIGVLNVVLLAPLVLQLVHLLVADALWIAVVLMAAAVLSSGPRGAPAGTALTDETMVASA